VQHDRAAGGVIYGEPQDVDLIGNRDVLASRSVVDHQAFGDRDASRCADVRSQKYSIGNVDSQSWNDRHSVVQVRTKGTSQPDLDLAESVVGREADATRGIRAHSRSHDLGVMYSHPERPRNPRELLRDPNVWRQLIDGEPLFGGDSRNEIALKPRPQSRRRDANGPLHIP
jgi:hypothetical protein